MAYDLNLNLLNESTDRTQPWHQAGASQRITVQAVYTDKRASELRKRDWRDVLLACNFQLAVNEKRHLFAVSKMDGLWSLLLDGNAVSESEAAQMINTRIKRFGRLYVQIVLCTRVTVNDRRYTYLLVKVLNAPQYMETE